MGKDNRFGENLKEARVRLGYTQEYMGEKIGVAKETWNNWEKGTRKPGIDKIRLIAKVLNVSADALLDIEPPKTSGPLLADAEWYNIWIDDKKAMIETMVKNMAADLNAGYSYFGNSIQEQKRKLEAYEKEYHEQLMAFATMKDGEVDRWCYFDILRRGVI